MMPQVTLSAKIMSGVRGGEVQDAPIASPESAIGPEDWVACDPREIPSEAPRPGLLPPQLQRTLLGGWACRMGRSFGW